MTIRSHESCDDDDVCFAFALPPAHQPPPPSSPRLEATRAKLEERRAGILSASASTSAAVHRRHPRRRRSCGGDVHSGIESDYYCEQRQRQRHFEEGGLNVSLRRHSDPTTFEERRRVTFSAPLVTDVEYRPYTCPSERPFLFYSRAEIALFKAQKRSRRGGGGCTRDVSFPPGGNVVTEVWDPVPVERYEEEREMREGMYYTKEELHGFLQDFLKSLEDGGNDDDDGDDGERCEEDAPTNDSGETSAADDAERVGESACATTAFPADEQFDDPFDDVPLDDGDNSVQEGSGDDSDSDADSDDEEESEGGGVPAAAAVWPAPSRRTATSVAVPDLLPPASPKCHRDVVDCGAAAPGMEQLPALPIMGC